MNNVGKLHLNFIPTRRFMVMINDKCMLHGQMLGCGLNIVFYSEQ